MLKVAFVKRIICAVNLYLEVDGESKGYRQVKCESKTHELELLISNLMDPIGEKHTLLFILMFDISFSEAIDLWKSKRGDQLNDHKETFEL